MFKKKHSFFFFTQKINYKSNEIVNKYDDNNLNPFVPTVPTFAVRETQSLGQQMLELSCENATVGTNGLSCHQTQTE